MHCHACRTTSKDLYPLPISLQIISRSVPSQPRQSVKDLLSFSAFCEAALGMTTGLPLASIATDHQVPIIDESLVRTESEGGEERINNIRVWCEL